ncbi:DUF2141 domain-containing protein [Iningainema tapete]|uniref:DUF2141 domain-containing protein n=1 Tax=Iningainema tapete BLCC-T55 TaxID=2748662 RepID=A0A8J7BZE3_9CYAN|nr:DUF2141 domain-containing protein [Iningainema tapete]MBD2775698.1 DUF2141 domain-containing protein [Iningainema tapete BLCC-T55]
MQRFLAQVLLLSIIGTTIASHANANVASSNSLTVTVSGLRNQKGRICLSLFSAEQGFPNKKERATEAQCFKAGEGSIAVKFNNLLRGSYAVAVIHDANEDGTLNRGLFGIPEEGFGFSRNPNVRMGPPKFKDAAIFVAGQSIIQVELKYFL